MEKQLMSEYADSCLSILLAHAHQILVPQLVEGLEIVEEVGALHQKLF